MAKVQRAVTGFINRHVKEKEKKKRRLQQFCQGAGQTFQEVKGLPLTSVLKEDRRKESHV